MTARTSTFWVTLAALLAFAGKTPALSTLAPSADPPPDSRCPYDFRSDMPEGEFCVYRGSITSADGAVCVGDAVVIWSSYGASEETEGAGKPAREVYFGFVDLPLVLRAVAPAPMSARLIDYASSDDRPEEPLDGRMTLDRRAAGPGSLSMKLRSSIELDALGTETGCDFDSYRGVFIGVMRGPDTRDPS